VTEFGALRLAFPAGRSSLAQAILTAQSDEAINFRSFQDAGLLSRSFKTGETIFKHADPMAELYCVESGRLGSYLGDRQLLVVGPNGIFGEMSSIENELSDATSIAETDVTLAAVSQKGFVLH
jgi:CRP-like cAMP-binding protein